MGAALDPGDYVEFRVMRHTDSPFWVEPVLWAVEPKVLQFGHVQTANVAKMGKEAREPMLSV